MSHDLVQSHIVLAMPTWIAVKNTKQWIVWWL